MLNNDIADLKIAIRNQHMKDQNVQDVSSFNDTSKKDKHTNYLPDSQESGTQVTQSQSQTYNETDRTELLDILDESIWPDIVYFIRFI